MHKKAENIREIILGGLFVLLIGMTVYNYYQFKQEYIINEKVFTFHTTDIDKILNDNLLVKDNITLHLGTQYIEGYNPLSIEQNLDPCRCTRFYALIQRWYMKYLKPLLLLLAIILLARIILNPELISFIKMVKIE